jgi:ApaG protein
VQPLFFYRQTDGIRITVRPRYLPEQSRPSQRHFVFAYFVRIENVGKLAAQLLTRRWLIHDSVGDGIDTEVIGEGVVGEQPTITPGAVHEYQSFCILKSGEGYMEGHYGFLRQNGSEFEAEIPRFTLSASESTSLPS